MMIKQKRAFSVALDCDDVLMPCMSKALQEVNEKYGMDATEDEITGWLPCGTRADLALERFKDPNFFATQVPFPGAQEFVKKLSEIAEVYIVTAIPIIAASTRAELIRKYFPEIDESHIVLTSSKNLVHIDVLLDDGTHNILSTPATYPVLMRRPWNKSLTGVLAVNNYDEFLKLVQQIINRYSEKPFDKNEPAVVALVGPSGTGKTTIAEALIATHPEKFEKPRSYTTRQRRANESEKAYNFTDEVTFKDMMASGEIFESTIYSGNRYGSSLSEVKKVLDSGKSVVLPLDMCGAIGMKTAFENAIIVYVDRHKRDLLFALLERDCSTEDKVNRIISLPAEENNAELCDFVIENNGSVDEAVAALLQILD